MVSVVLKTVEVTQVDHVKDPVHKEEMDSVVVVQVHKQLQVPIVAVVLTTVEVPQIEFIDLHEHVHVHKHRNVPKILSSKDRGSAAGPCSERG